MRKKTVVDERIHVIGVFEDFLDVSAEGSERNLRKRGMGVLFTCWPFSRIKSVGL